MEYNSEWANYVISDGVARRHDCFSLVPEHIFHQSLWQLGPSSIALLLPHFRALRSGEVGAEAAHPYTSILHCLYMQPERPYIQLPLTRHELGFRQKKLVLEVLWKSLSEKSPKRKIIVCAHAHPSFGDTDAQSPKNDWTSWIIIKWNQHLLVLHDLTCLAVSAIISRSPEP